MNIPKPKISLFDINRTSTIMNEAHDFDVEHIATGENFDQTADRVYIDPLDIRSMDDAIQDYLNPPEEYTEKLFSIFDSSENTISDIFLDNFSLNSRMNVYQAINAFSIIENVSSQKIVADQITKKCFELKMFPKIPQNNPLYNYIPEEMKLKPINESIVAKKIVAGKIPIKKKEVTIEDEIYVPVYVLLTSNKTLMGSAIRKFTSELYNHASISFDHTLNSLYSFNVSGFVEESINSGSLSELAKQGSKYTLYVTLIKKSKADKIEEAIETIKNNVENTSYNLEGLLRYALSIPNKKYNEYHQFCSEFVTNMLKIADDTIVKTQASLTSPVKIITESDKFVHVSKGLLSTYKSNKTLTRLKAITVSNRVSNYLVENSLFFNNYFYTPDFSKYIVGVKNFDFFKYFHPCVKFGLENQMKSSVGGLYLNFDKDFINGTFDYEFAYSSGYSDIYNMYKTSTISKGKLDVDHILMCSKLYRIVNMILNGEYINMDSLSNEYKDILISWRDRVTIHKHKLGLAKNKNEEDIQKQYLHDLLWDYHDDISDIGIINGNIVGFCYELNIVGLLSETYDLLDPTEAFAYLRKYVLTDDTYFLLPSEMMYPIFDKNSVSLAMGIIDTIDDVYKKQYIERLNQKYIELRCNFKILSNHPYAKYAPTSIIDPIETINEFSSNYNSFGGVSVNFKGSDMNYSSECNYVDISEDTRRLVEKTADIFSRLLKPGERI